MESGRLVVPLLLNERPILGHILESLENRLLRDLDVAGEFFGGERIRTIDSLGRPPVARGRRPSGIDEDHPS